MPQRRHRYDRQFKLAAAALVLEGEIPVIQIFNELDVPANTLRRWADEYRRNGESSFPGNGSPTKNEDYEIAKLKRENEDLKEEVALKKTSGPS